MGWLTTKMNSSVGQKVVMAITGLMLFGFLIVHLLGNLSFFRGPEAINGYAATLHSLGALVWVARFMLLGIFVAHLSMAIKLTISNRAARPVPYVNKIFQKTSVASRLMVITGLMILFFVLFHLNHYTLKWTYPEFNDLDGDVYRMIIMGFSQPLTALFYILAIILLGVHLYHGLPSTAQSLGIYHKKYNCAIVFLGRFFAVVIAIGYISIPLSVLFGIIK